MLFQKTKFIPISPLIHYKIVFDMEEATTTQPQRVFPFHYGPFSIFKNIFNNTNHLSCCKLVGKHPVYGFFSHYRSVGYLMIHGIIRI